MADVSDDLPKTVQRQASEELKAMSYVEMKGQYERPRMGTSRRYKHMEGVMAIISKLLCVAERSWRKLTASELMPLVASNTTFKHRVNMKSGRERKSINHQPDRTAVVIFLFT